MRQLVIFGCFILFIAACSSKNKVPKEILPKEEMEDVLWDLLRGGEFLELYKLPNDTSLNKTAKAQEWYDEIFRLHKTDRTSFQKSYTWYKLHPEVMKELLDSLTNKQAPESNPTPQSALDSATLKKDSSHRMDNAIRIADSLKRALMQSGRIPYDSIALKNADNRIKKDSIANLIVLPGHKKSKLMIDSARRARARKLPD